MALAGLLSRFAMYQVMGEASEVAMRFLTDRICDQGKILVNALELANDRAWKALEVSLAGESLWNKFDKAEDKGLTVWSVAKKDSQWFSPSDSSFMINYRVDNMDEMIAQLRAGGVEIIQGPESHENGKFAWIMDPDGNKVELWEPMIWDDKNKGA